MTEYIDKSKLYNAIASREEEYRSVLLRERNYNTPTALQMQGLLNATTLIKHMISDYPAADVRPIVRGKWIYGKEIAREYLAGERIAVDYEDILCSVCKTHYRPYVGNFNYCPNCGADMREANDDRYSCL